jgi:hypothetical protein
MIRILLRGYRFISHLHVRLFASLMRFVTKSNFFSNAFYNERRNHLSKTYLTVELEHNNYFTIDHGPFIGMKYIYDKSIWFDPIYAIAQKKLGVYEQENLNFISSRKWQLFIDIGGGTGYYSVGMLQANLCEYAIIFESEVSYHDKIIKNFNINQVSNKLYKICNEAIAQEIILEIDKKIDPNGLDSILLCDIEGYENVLFQSNFLNQLASRKIILIIEVHPHLFFIHGEHKSFLGNLQDFFEVVALPTMNRDLTDKFMFAPEVTDRWLFASENRSEGCQLLCVPK